ncbi:MAG: DUF3422 domain-containing protein [Glaciimonas sp.]|nr:DUF3422 domain-containing protein [Glaciimonas sp.]
MTFTYSRLNHPLRVPLAAEVHSRPSLRLSASENLTHLAVYAQGNSSVGNDNLALQHAILADLCVYFGAAAPTEEAKYFFHDFGQFRLQWECHTEFATYTFAKSHVEQAAVDDIFDHMPLALIPQGWLLRLEGKLMVAAHVALGPSDAAALPGLCQVLDGGVLVGSTVLQGGEVWTDFLVKADGFSRFVIRDLGFQAQQAGRVVQRVLEVETYRMMALLGLPHAQYATPLLNDVESELTALTTTMTDTDAAILDALSSDTNDEQILLRKITGLAARIEKLSMENSYRFAASQAYFRLVKARIEELREIRINGVPTVGEFMARRLSPAMNTCESVVRRQEALAERIAHTNDLLRTRVGIVQERQNRKILESLNARAAQQLRLQQAVEGLSVVAISYYLAGLIGYVGKAMKASGLPVNPDVATGILVPVIALGVWLGLRRLHKRVGRQ